MTSPAHGSVELNSDGSFTYTPAANFHGADSFLYAVSDEISMTTATVTITVSPAYDPPQAVNDGYGVNLALSAELTVAAAAGVLANDINIDGGPITAVLDSGPAHGTLTLSTEGSFVYVGSSTITSWRSSAGPTKSRNRTKRTTRPSSPAGRSSPRRAALRARPAVPRSTTTAARPASGRRSPRLGAVSRPLHHFGSSRAARLRRKSASRL